jgi:hypothetical protein
MKKSTTAVLAVMLLALAAPRAKAQEKAQADLRELNTSLTSAFNEFSSASNMGGWMTANNKFNLIAAKWGDQWVANYYAAYSNASISMKEPDPKRKDQLLDVADNYVEKMNSLDGASDEGMVLTAYVAFARFLVDPRNRWKKYLDLMNSDLDRAKKTNPDNPRIYLLEGIPVFNKPKLYGGGKDKAKPYFEKAKELFAKQGATDITRPSWGEKENAGYLAQCNK